MLQFSPSDTIKWVEQYGNGRNGDASLSGNFSNPHTTYTGVQGQFTGVVGDVTGFSVGDIVKIHQSREGGDGAGNWQFNKIKAIDTGTNTLTFKYANQSDFDTKAQIINIYQNRDIAIDSSLSAFGWNGTNYGIVVLMAKRKIVINSSINVTGRGYRSFQTAEQGCRGEGTLGLGSDPDDDNNGNGGGGDGPSRTAGNAGAGGGNGTAGANSNTGIGGTTSGNAALTLMTFGGGGGSGSNDGTGGASTIGVYGGGIVLLIAPLIIVTGAILAGPGPNTDPTGATNGGGGGGAGGSVFGKCERAILGTGLVLANGGAGNQGHNGGSTGGTGGEGRIRFEYAKSVSGTTSPAASLQKSPIFFRRRTPAALMNFAKK